MLNGRMTIAIDLSILVVQPLTGVGYHALSLVGALLRNHPELDVRLFASSMQAIPDCILELGESASLLCTKRLPTRLKYMLWTRCNWPPIEYFTGDVDVAHGTFHLLPAARRAARVVTVHDLSTFSTPAFHTAESIAFHGRFLRHAARRGDALIAVSESCKRDLIEYVGASEEKIHVVLNGVDTEEFEGPLDADALDLLKARLGIGGEYFIHLGTVQPRKNLPRLLEAYARVRERHAECPQLVLAGSKGWMYEPTFEAIERLGLSSSVVYAGYLSRADAVLLLRGGYACVYPSLYEGFGLPVLEAMAARLPVLTSNVSSLPEVAGDTAILIDPESVDEIEGGLERLIVERTEMLKLAAAGYERAQQFTWDASAASQVAVYRRILEESA